LSVKAEVIIQAVERIAPKNLAMDWDNVGLQLGDSNREVERVLLTLDLTEEVLSEAEQLDVQMIITHHPLFWEKINNLNYNSSMGRLVSRLIKKDLVVYSAHTNLDIAPGGINDYLANILNLEQVEPLQTTYEEKLFKLVVFVPQTHLEQVREALAVAGAGWIGNYSHCAFVLSGIGSFKPLAGTNPFIGNVGRLEYVEEYRLETIVSTKLLNRAIKAMLKAHPYEEVAYDIYPLANEGKKQGLGRIGYLASPLTLEEFAKQVKSVLRLSGIRICGNPAGTIKKVALCGGSGMSTVKHAIFKGADLLLTGDIKYHDAQDALARGISLIDADHFPTENIFIPILAEQLKEIFAKEGRKVELLITEQLVNPFIYL
jgi:dinuclear metal center YbgI/SA1388 family protein